MPEEWQQHWAGTHFFNPPRYLKLVEIIPGPATLPEVIDTLADFCDHKLGKGVVVAKDTPNFIANRIGTFSMLNAIRLMDELGMTFEEVDACTGPALGWPKSATFRLADIVGIDVLLHVIRNIYENIPNDESRELYRVPPLIEEMVRRGWLGDKTGSGFYKRVKKSGGESEILTLDPAKMEYRPQQKARFASIEAGKAIERHARAAAHAGRPGARRKRRRQGAEIHLGRDLRNVPLRRAARAGNCGLDRRRGPRHALGLWLGTGAVRGVGRHRRRAHGAAARKRRQGAAAARHGAAFLGKEIVLRIRAGRDFVFRSCRQGTTSPRRSPTGIIILKSLKDRAKEIEKNSGASLIDLGDGVLCCEFHSKMNAIGGDLLAMIHKGLARLRTDFDAMVIANQAVNFSAGANLMLILMTAQEQEWDDLHLAVRQFQNATLAIKHSPKPVVVAPQGLALGGGCEVVLHGTRIHAAAEAYIGLVETGVGLIPAGGGTKEMIIRANEHAEGEEDLDLFHALKPVFENIAMAKVSTSGEEARELGYLRRADLVAMNLDRLVADAKANRAGPGARRMAADGARAHASPRSASSARNSAPPPSSPST